MPFPSPRSASCHTALVSSRRGGEMGVGWWWSEEGDWRKALKGDMPESAGKWETIGERSEEGVAVGDMRVFSQRRFLYIANH